MCPSLLLYAERLSLLTQYTYNNRLKPRRRREYLNSSVYPTPCQHAQSESDLRLYNISKRDTDKETSLFHLHMLTPPLLPIIQPKLFPDLLFLDLIPLCFLLWPVLLLTPVRPCSRHPARPLVLLGQVWVFLHQPQRPGAPSCERCLLVAVASWRRLAGWRR